MSPLLFAAGTIAWAPRRRSRCLGLGPLYARRARSARDSILRARDLSGSRDDPVHGALHGAGRARHRHAMQHEGRQGAPVAARGPFSVEWLRPVPAIARPTELHLSHLIPLNPGKSRIGINVWPTGTAEPNRNRGEKSGPVPRFRSSYAFDPVRVLFDLTPSLRHARTCSGHLHRPGATEGRGWPGQARP